MKDNMLALE